MNYRSNLKSHSAEDHSVENGLNIALETHFKAKNINKSPSTVVIIAFSGSSISNQFSILPFHQKCSPHWFLFSERSIESQIEPYRVIARRCGSILDTFEFGIEPPSKFHSRLESLILSTLEPFNSMLCIGRIQTEVQVSPNPRWSGWDRIAQRNGFSSVFPKILSVTGFLPTRATYFPPSIVQFTLSCPSSSSSANSTSNGNNDPSLNMESENALILFSRGLETTERVAVVELEAGWFGLILLSMHNDTNTSAKISIASTSTSNMGTASLTHDPIIGVLDEGERYLVLHILERNSSLPFIGPLSSLIVESNHPPTAIIPRALAEHAVMELSEDQLLVTALPVLPPSSSPDYNPSYNPSPAQLEDFVLLGDEESLVIEMARLQSYSQDLPNQRVNLFKQSERLRMIAETHELPGLIESVAAELRKDIAKSRTTTLTSIIVLRLIEDIMSENFPLEWSEQAEYEVERAREKKRNVRNRKSTWDD